MLTGDLPLQKKSESRHLFYDEPGVLKLDRPETMKGGKDGKGKRRYRSIRIPQSVAERVHRRLSGKAA